ncbi:hypothetical protein QVD17_32200 [Tagetes erecta]|uniref:Bulb-type lectin domain-containing protein n=1 Tax=Tagetes erecta TaxID=13708 RepID=A0AAD8K4T6_TARER|nr:hypothetical protein QVD17_32200 [Tagetes erecta]
MPSLGFPQVVWSANRNHPVKLGAKLKLNAAGDLILQDADGSKVWSTKTAGKHVAGMRITDTGNLKLIASVSSTNWGKGLYAVEVTNKGLFGYFQKNPRRVYYKYLVNGSDESKERSYVRFLNGSLSLFIHSAEPSRRPDGVIRVPRASSAQYMKLMPNGHLKVFEWEYTGWRVVADLFGPPRRSL